MAGVKMGGGGWDAEADDHRGHNGARYLYVCPSGGNDLGRGSGARTSTPTTASVCTAAVQVGVITPAAGGNVTIELRPGQKAYAAFTHNGVTSRVVPRLATAASSLAGAPQIPGSPSGTGGGGGGGGGGGDDHDSGGGS